MGRSCFLLSPWTVAIVLAMTLVAVGQDREALARRARAQETTWVALELERRADRGGLSPELAAAVEANASFAGISRDGRPVLAFRDQDAEAVASAVGKVNGVLSSPKTSAQSFDAINELVVSFDDVRWMPSGAELAGLPIILRHEHGNGPFVVVASREETVSASVLRGLVGVAGGPRIEPDYRFRLHADVHADTPCPAAVRADQRHWGHDHARIDAAWTQQPDAAGVAVAVLDSGVWVKHPDLDDNLALARGWDFVRNVEDVVDTSGHGTQVAGLLGAEANGSGALGFAPKLDVIPIRVFAGPGETASLSRITQGIDHAIDQGASIILCCFGARIAGPPPTCLQRRIDRAQSTGRLIVASAGNEEPGITSDVDVLPVYPACCANPNVVSVLAVDRTGHFGARNSDRDLWVELMTQSNFGATSVDLGAPGVGLVTTTLATYPVDPYEEMTGTSAAAPLVAGAAALIWKRLGASAAAAAVKDRLLALVRTVPVRPAPSVGLAGRCTTGGTLDLGAFPGDDQTLHAGGYEAEGILDHPVFAVGGETTGTVVRTTEGELELDLGGDAALLAQAERLAGKRVRLRGRLRTAVSLERGERKILAVSSLEEFR